MQYIKRNKNAVPYHSYENEWKAETTQELDIMVRSRARQAVGYKD